MLRTLNVLLVCAGAAALAAAWWVVGRAAPKTNGMIDAPVAAEVSVVRDKLGVPHIRAQSIEDAIFAQGYVTAQDRMWQMDMIRRVAAGDVSEVAGPAALEIDTLSRKMRLRRLAEQILHELGAEERRVIAAYARGVNHYIRTNAGKWGPEFTLMGYEPRPWSPVDTLLAGLHMNRTLSDSWEDDIARFRMSGDGDPAKVRRLFPVRTGNEIIPGSNAWAVAGRHTASGKPILASDPHLEYTMPATWYVIHMQAPGLNVVGASLPGVPMVLIGHNERIAWGITSLQFDAQDLYIEKLDINTGRYAYKGQFRDAQRETELIAVKGQRPAQIVNFVTIHGPIFTAEGRNHMALRWAAAELSDGRFPLLPLNVASNWREFRSALANFPGPGLNFIYADRDGNIGHQVAGQIPLRDGFTGELPVDGETGAYEWRGAIPFDQLPSYFNPASGRVISANQNPFPEAAPYPVSGSFAAPFRQRQIDERLTARERWQPREMLSVQTDVYSAFSHFLARSVLEAATRKQAGDGDLRAAVNLLDAWRGRVDRSQAAPVLVENLYREVRRRLAESAAPKTGARYRFETAPGAVEALLRERPTGWFADWDQMLLDALSEAFQSSRRQAGNNPARWEWGRQHSLFIGHPVFGKIRFLGSLFSIGPVEMSGSSTTVQQTTTRLGPSLRFIADLSDWDKSLISLPGGQSGHITSGHYKDLWQDYYDGKAATLQFSRVQGDSTLMLKPARH